MEKEINQIIILLSVMACWFLFFGGWVRLKDGVIVFRSLFKKVEIPLEDLQAALYHYHAVVGFVFVWELRGKDEKEIEISLFTLGRLRLLKNLERNLPGFSLKKFKELFEEGDVEDTLEVWKREFPENSGE